MGSHKLPPAGQRVLKYIEFHVRNLADVKRAQATVQEWVVAAAEEEKPRIFKDVKTPEQEEQALAWAEENAKKRWGAQEFESLVASLVEAERQMLRSAKGALA